jgi:hypothetical protein
MPSKFSAQGGAALGQVLRACSSSLKSAKLFTRILVFGTAYIRELVPGITSCCDTLELLHCHWAVFSALPATCPSFARLTELTLGGGRERDTAFTPGVWDTVAKGGLPALKSFSTSLMFESGGPGKTFYRLARALEAVAGTLQRLSLFGPPEQDPPAGAEQDPPAGACYELGAAVGKLRRLSHLSIGVFKDGRDFHYMGQGVAASGGCPKLFKVEASGITKSVDRLAFKPSLIVPSVRDLSISGSCTEDEALLLCCGLVEIGSRYCFRYDLTLNQGASEHFSACWDALYKCRVRRPDGATF